MIYFDSSALFKLVHVERETSILRHWVDEHPDDPWLSSVLAQVEVMRICRRYEEAVSNEARELLNGMNLIPLRTGIVETACHVGDSVLRSLDAIHLASALTMRPEISAFCAYDHRLQKAAEAAGFSVVAPGQAPR